ncbi:TauD/TfdA family dioxygenase [Actinophytocola gossypii]|uniref:TauD/TfdA family dioxygenase n=1 Tax=Actinophytocola gossypii TaxID=2812003 RepID=A0ABT2J2Q3_9PSEU|nr:TauD/TfdA family dioxygenase [Actinophytocola gossypii]MCT2582126.1 TauD/TfdA family dioxygenase [Actinophytocola gossypii]
MLLSHAFTDAERDELSALLRTVGAHPYRDPIAFSGEVAGLVRREEVPSALIEVTDRIRKERETGAAFAHALRNCPLDENIPLLDQRDPLADKYAKKTTFVAESFLQLFGHLVGTPLLSYGSRFNGDFFIDVIAIDRYRGKQTGYSDGELAFHNDRTAHPVRADYITLLGMRCPEEDITYTGFVSGPDLLAALTERERHTLRQPYFYTPFDVLSRDRNNALTVSDNHAVFYGEHSVRYVDTHTTVTEDAPPEAKDALIALKNALVRTEKVRHRIRTGDLFTFANQDGLHSREHVEINDPERARTRWLLKTYGFRDQATADRFADRWLEGVPGRVGD